LQFALMQFGMDVLGDETTLAEIAEGAGLTDKVSTKPFVPVLPPLMVRTDVYEATGRLDKEETTYKLEGDDAWLEASAEHSLAPMYKDEILAESELPKRYVGYATSFRREAGTYGKDMEGILRMHQFDKLEMESFTTAEVSMDEHLFLIAVQEHLMQRLELPYQVLMKCTADIGGPNARGVDIEVWLPGQDKYRETHTADLITDYQTRRLQTRVRRANGEVELAHTNDATAFSQRPLIAILENYQQADGSVHVPEVLRLYMGGRSVL
jgi:seryl-tRNA synthetase